MVVSFRLVGKVRRALCQRGWRNVLHELRLRLCYVTSTTWYECKLEELKQETDGPASIEVELDRPDLTLSSMPEEDRNPLLVRTALDWNHLLPHALLDRKVVGYVLIGLGQVFIADYRRCINLPATTAFIYDSFVKKELRGRRTLAKMVAISAEHLRHQGIKRLLCHIPGWNTSSRRAYTRLGFMPVGRVTYSKFPLISFFLTHPQRLLNSR